RTVGNGKQNVLGVGQRRGNRDCSHVGRIASAFAHRGGFQRQCQRQVIHVVDRDRCGRRAEARSQGRDADPLRITNGGRGDGRQPKSSARLIGRNNDAGRDRQDRGIAAVQRDGQRGREIRVAHYRGSDRIGTRVVGHGIRAQDHGQRRRIVVHDRDRRGHGRKTGGGGSERL